MANVIKPKRTNTAGNTPTTSNLTSGELGVNMADKKIYINNGTSIVQIGSGNLSGLGDVSLSTPVSTNLLSYNGTNWVNLAPSSINGVGSLANTLTIGTGLSGTSYNGSSAVTVALSTSGVSAGSYGSSTNIPVITFDAYGRATSVSTASVQGGAALSNDTSTSTNLYPLFANAITGTPTTVYTSNAKYLYKPSTGELQASVHISANGLTVNSNTISTSYIIPTGNSAMSVGPATVASGVTVTVSSGSRWVVL